MLAANYAGVNGPQCGADAAAPSGLDHQLDAPAIAPHRQRMDQDLQQPVVAAGVILRSPAGRILMLNRTDGMGWAFPGGGVKEGETPEEAAWRECWEETGHRCGGLKFLMQRTKDDGQGMVTFHTYVADCDSEFVPAMNHEHDSHAWLAPDSLYSENRDDDMHRADATPVVGGEGAAALEASLKEGMVQDELERVADQDQGFEQELQRSAAGPDPMLETPAYPPPLADDAEDPDDDLDDETLDLCLSVIGDLEDRLERLEEGVRD